jgi:hypothetical protein
MAGMLGMAGGLDIAAAAESQTSEELPKFEGTISAIDASRSLVTVAPWRASDDAAPMEFQVDATTTITKAGLRMQPADLHVSDQKVIVHYATDGSVRVARMIDFEKPGGLMRASGTVERFDVLSGKLWLRPDGLFAGRDDKAFSFNERSILTQHGARTYLANVKAGDQVELWCVKDGDETIVYSGIVTPMQPQLDIQGGIPGTERKAPAAPGRTSTQ